MEAIKTAVIAKNWDLAKQLQDVVVAEALSTHDYTELAKLAELLDELNNDRESEKWTRPGDRTRALETRLYDLTNGQLFPALVTDMQSPIRAVRRHACRSIGCFQTFIYIDRYMDHATTWKVLRQLKADLEDEEDPLVCVYALHFMSLVARSYAQHTFVRDEARGSMCVSMYKDRIPRSKQWMTYSAEEHIDCGLSDRFEDGHCGDTDIEMDSEEEEDEDESEDSE
jgi:hypothetical protein